MSIDWGSNIETAMQTVTDVMDDKKPTESLGPVFALLREFQAYEHFLVMKQKQNSSPVKLLEVQAG